MHRKINCRRNAEWPSRGAAAILPLWCRIQPHCSCALVTLPVTRRSTQRQTGGLDFYPTFQENVRPFFFICSSISFCFYLSHRNGIMRISSACSFLQRSILILSMVHALPTSNTNTSYLDVPPSRLFLLRAAAGLHAARELIPSAELLLVRSFPNDDESIFERGYQNMSLLMGTSQRIQVWISNGGRQYPDQWGPLKISRQYPHPARRPFSINSIHRDLGWAIGRVSEEGYLSPFREVVLYQPTDLDPDRFVYVFSSFALYPGTLWVDTKTGLVIPDPVDQTLSGASNRSNGTLIYVS